MQPKWYGKMTTTGKSTRHDSEYARLTRHTTTNTHTNFSTASKTSTIYITTLGICVYCNMRCLIFIFVHRFPCVMCVCKSVSLRFVSILRPKNHFRHNELKPTGACTLSSIEWEKKRNAQMPHWFVCLLPLLNCFIHFILTHSLSVSVALSRLFSPKLKIYIIV